MPAAHATGLICQRRTTGGYNSPFHPRFHTEEQEVGSQSWSSAQVH